MRKTLSKMKVLLTFIALMFVVSCILFEDTDKDQSIEKCRISTLAAYAIMVRAAETETDPAQRAAATRLANTSLVFYFLCDNDEPLDK